MRKVIFTLIFLLIFSHSFAAADTLHLKNDAKLEGKVVKKFCDLCDGEPECVKNCPPEALMFITPSNVASKARLKSIKNLFQVEKKH